MTLIYRRQIQDHRDTVQGPRAVRFCRDRELLRFVGRHGIVAIEHVMAAMGVGRTAAYRRVAACVDAGLLERLELLRSEPSLLRATRQGLRYAGLGLPVAVVSPGAVGHWLRCASTAQLLGEEFGPDRVLTERELIRDERVAARPIASAKLGQLPSGAPRLHRPDLVVLPPLAQESASNWELEHTRPHPACSTETQGPSNPRTQGGRRGERTAVRDRAARTEDTGVRSAPASLIAVEVELTPKAPRRLEQILRAWRRTDWVAEVRYYCEPGPTRRAVERAIAATYAEDKVRILEAVPRARSEQASLLGGAQGASQPGSSATEAKPKPVESDSSRRERSGNRCSK